MKSVDFTVQRLLGTTCSESNARTRYGAQSPPSTDDRNYDHVASCDVTDDVNDDKGSPAGARREDCDKSPARPRLESRVVEPMLIHPSVYFDYARQFLWQLTAAYRPGCFP